MDTLISFGLAFLIGGALCAVFQMFAIITKIDPPKILIAGFALGAILVPVGAIAALEAYGGAGMSIMVLDAGAGMFNAISALLQGNLVPFATITAVFLALTVIGLTAGAIRCRVTR